MPKAKTLIITIVIGLLVLFLLIGGAIWLVGWGGGSGLGEEIFQVNCNEEDTRCEVVPMNHGIDVGDYGLELSYFCQNRCYESVILFPGLKCNELSRSDFEDSQPYNVGINVRTLYEIKCKPISD